MMDLMDANAIRRGYENDHQSTRLGKSEHDKVTQFGSDSPQMFGQKGMELVIRGSGCRTETKKKNQSLDRDTGKSGC